MRLRKTVYVKRDVDSGGQHSDYIFINENSILDSINSTLHSSYFRN
jgi:hypothetical protein